MSGKDASDRIKYISFDLDGTLADDNFDKLIWHEEIPKLYAKKQGMSLEDAKLNVYATYYRALDIERVKTWTDIGYWFDRFGLHDWRQLVNDMKKHVFLYPDTISTLEHLSKKYKLIIVSNAGQKFLDVKLDAEGLSGHFDHVFSAPDTFGIARKNRVMFRKILEKLEVSPEEIIHVGDDYDLDYEVPSSLGIESFHLVRPKKSADQSDGHGRHGHADEAHVIHSLAELKEKF